MIYPARWQILRAAPPGKPAVTKARHQSIPSAEPHGAAGRVRGKFYAGGDNVIILQTLVRSLLPNFAAQQRVNI